MEIELLKKALLQIPPIGVMNISRRREIMSTIIQLLSKKEVEKQ